MNIYPYSDGSIGYAGRWVDSTDGKFSGWQGSQIKFKVRGSLTLKITCNIRDTNSSDICLAAINTDSSDVVIKYFTSAPGAATGEVSVIFNLPDTNEHFIVLKLAGIPNSQFSLSSYCKLMSISTEDSGEIIKWDTGPIKLQVIGDSWMGVEHDWPLFLNSEKFSVYPVSFGGATISQLNSRYDYIYSGSPVVAEPEFDIVLISSGVNDYVQGVSGASYYSSMLSLVDKIRLKQANARIYLLSTPRNIPASKTYDQYTPYLKQVKAVRPFVEIIELSTTLWESLAWSGDTYHLTLSGRKNLAAYVESVIKPYKYLELNTDEGTVLNLQLVEALNKDAVDTPCVVINGALFKLVLESSQPAVEKLLVNLPSGLNSVGVKE